MSGAGLALAQALAKLFLMSPRPRFLGVALSWALLFASTAGPTLAQAPPTAPTPSAEELQHLVDTLQDPAARQKLIADLQALLAAQQGAAPPKEAARTSFLDQLSEHADAVVGEIVTSAQLVFDAPQLFTWLSAQANDPEKRQFWSLLAVKLALIFGAGYLAARLVRLALDRTAARFSARAVARTAPRPLLILLDLVIEAAPVIAFAFVANFTLPFTHPQAGARIVAEIMIDAIVVVQIVLAAARVALISPVAAALHGIGGETQNYLYIWARRLTFWAVYGYAVAQSSWWLGVPGAVYALLLRGSLLVLAVLLIVFILQNRKPVADWLRTGTGWRPLRERIADIWHLLAAILVVGCFGVFVLNIAGGYVFLVRASALSILVPVAAMLLVQAIERLSRRGFAVSPELKSRYPSLEARANRYLPAFYYVTATVVYALATLALLQAWGFHAFAWLETATGRKSTGNFITIAAVLLAALFVWEFISAAIERYLAASDQDGRPLARSNRARTLLPLMRSTLLIFFIVILGMILLSEIGLNIAPLLASAGVIGIAIGVGAQTLVKDVITGLFILVEDTLAVGEFVDIGKAQGTVESLTIRTIRVRDLAGTLYTVPFSEVATIRNMTRDYAYALLDIGVLYSTDIDEVTGLVRQVGDDLAQDPEWKWRILEPIEIFGLERFSDTAQVVRVRIKTAPLQQWAVQREFNRRIKQAFDRHGIEMPSMNQTHYLQPPPKA